MKGVGFEDLRKKGDLIGRGDGGGRGWLKSWYNTCNSAVR